MTKLNLKPIIGDPQQVKFVFIPVPVIFFEDDRLLDLTQNTMILYSYYLNRSKYYFKKGNVENNRAYVLESPKFIENATKISFSCVKSCRKALYERGLIDLGPGIDNDTPKVFVNDVNSLPDQELHRVLVKEPKKRTCRNSSNDNRNNAINKEKSSDTLPEADKSYPAQSRTSENKNCLVGSQKTTTSNSKIPAGKKSLFCSLLSARESKEKQIEVIDRYFTKDRKALLGFDAEDRLYAQTLLRNLETERDYRFFCLVLTNTYVSRTFKFCRNIKDDLMWIERNGITTVVDLLNYFNKNHRKQTIVRISNDPKAKNIKSEDRAAYVEERLRRTEVDYISRNRDLLNSMYFESKDLSEIVEAISFLTTQQPNLFWHLRREVTSAVWNHLPALIQTLIMNCLFDTTQAYRYVEASDDQIAKTALYVKRIHGRIELDQYEIIKKWASHNFSESLIRAAFGKSEIMYECDAKYIPFSNVDKLLDVWAKKGISKEQVTEYEETRKNNENRRNRHYNDVPFLENEYTKEHIKLLGIKSVLSLFALVADIDDTHFNKLWKEYCDQHEEEINSIDWLNWMEHKAHNMDISDPKSIEKYDKEWKEYCERECQAS